MKISLQAPTHWKAYQLLDVGNFEKLERFGDYVLIRPEPQAVWSPALSQSEWEKLAHARFVPFNSSSGNWQKFKPMPDNWEINYQEPHFALRFRLALTAFKHIGIFPEQANNWAFIFDAVQQLKNHKPPKVLNLFAYTGGASLAAKAAGADVIHLDSVKQVVSWAKQNMELSKLDNIRWLVEDARKFVQRELKRGNTYNGILLDPPAYGLGPNGERWKLENQINELLADVSKILAPQHFLVLNTYSLGFSSLILHNLIEQHFSKAKPQIGELYLHANSGKILPLGVFSRHICK